jgi:glycine/D-amino acid oxidase-like deaminating enzyme
MDSEIDYAVIGGGLVGMSIAHGLMQLGRQVSVFDEGDRAFRASRGNFGLVWVQSKGAAMPDYARWTRASAALWPEFAADLEQSGGASCELSQPGGIDICLSEREAEEKIARLEGLRTALGGDYPFKFLGHNALRELIPEIGPSVYGATFFPEDGHANPLYLLRGLHSALTTRGGTLENGATVSSITPQSDAFIIDNGATWRARHIVLCAGLDNARLAPMVGLHAPVRPNRGHVLITERMRPFLKYPSVQVRQVGEGALQIGDSEEDAGYDDRTSPDVVAAIAARAIRMYPLLEHVRMVRSWSALRVMSHDGHPVYDRSQSHPRATLVTCHSGVTLAAAHSRLLAPWIIGDAAPDYMESFSAKRFDIPPPS